MVRPASSGLSNSAAQTLSSSLRVVKPERSEEPARFSACQAAHLPAVEPIAWLR
ncbi:hypothetical protein D3C72_1962670 [compost metagenome]